MRTSRRVKETLVALCVDTEHTSHQVLPLSMFEGSGQSQSLVCHLFLESASVTNDQILTLNFFAHSRTEVEKRKSTTESGLRIFARRKNFSDMRVALHNNK